MISFQTPSTDNDSPNDRVAVRKRLVSEATSIGVRDPDRLASELLKSLEDGEIGGKTPKEAVIHAIDSGLAELRADAPRPTPKTLRARIRDVARMFGAGPNVAEVIELLEPKLLENASRKEVEHLIQQLVESKPDMFRTLTNLRWLTTAEYRNVRKINPKALGLKHC